VASMCVCKQLSTDNYNKEHIEKNQTGGKRTTPSPKKKAPHYRASKDVVGKIAPKRKDSKKMKK